MSQQDPHGVEGGAHEVRYFRARDPEASIVYVQRPGLWQSYGSGPVLLVHTERKVPRKYIAQLKDIDEDQARELLFGDTAAAGSRQQSGEERLVDQLDREVEWPGPDESLGRGLGAVGEAILSFLFFR
ncbi:MAG: hypothetical protein JXA57_02075 [Armatimonadetes bacterium]|nr:hypothetical protein [Armatimonadota bacterium]